MATLKQKTITSIKWTMVFSVYMTISNSISLIVKSRFLNPEEFGALAILMIFIGLFQMLTDMGISQSIIQKRDITDQEISTLFYFNIFLCLAIGFIFYISSNALAILFKYEYISSLLQLASLIIIIKGPSLIIRAILEKALLFKKLVKIDVITDIIMQVTMIILLLLNYKLFSIVYSYIVAYGIQALILLYYIFKSGKLNIFGKFEPRLLFPFVNFGVYVTGQSILSFISSKIDLLVIGLLFSSEALGIYYFGKNLLERVHQVITTSFKKVVFPAFSNISHDIKKLELAYHYACKSVAFIAFPLFIGLALTSHLFIPIIFGEQWIESVIVIQVFSVFLIIKLVTDKMTISLLYALKKPNYVFYINLVTTVFYTGSLFILEKAGLYGILIAYSLFTLYRSLSLEYAANKLIKGNLVQFIKLFKKPFFGSLIMGAGIILFYQQYSSHLNSIVLLISSIILGAIIYLVSLRLIAKNELIVLVSNFKNK